MVAELESLLKKPVTSSNLSMAWHILSSLKVPGRHLLAPRLVPKTVLVILCPPRYGQLFKLDAKQEDKEPK